MEKKVIMIALVVVIVMSILTIFIPILFDKDSEQDVNTSSQTQNLDVECTSSIDCPQVSIESYCQNNSVYNKLHDYSCIENECVQKIGKPELVETCSEKHECKDGVCEPISILINSCGAYLTQKGAYYKLSKDITGNNLTEHCITIMEDNITFDCNGNSITSDSNYSGVYSEENDYITIKNCEIFMSEDRGIGISLYNNNYPSIINNKLNDQYIGLYLNWDTNAIIKDNTMKSNTYYGFKIEKGSSHEISGNTVCDNDEQDIKLIGASNIKGTGNKFGVVDQTSDGWPVLDADYVNCTS